MRQPKPFYRNSLKCWYLRIGKKFIRLSKDKPEAWKLYYAEMAKDQAAGANRAPVTADTPVANLVGKFLSWCEKDCERKKKPLTYRWYKRFLTSFVEAIGRSLPIGQLTKSQVTGWRDERYTERNGRKLSAACRRGAVVSVSRCIGSSTLSCNSLSGWFQRTLNPSLSKGAWLASWGAHHEREPNRQRLPLLRACGMAARVLSIDPRLSD